MSEMLVAARDLESGYLRDVYNGMRSFSEGRLYP